jgi:hypothetical protein
MFDHSLQFELNLTCYINQAQPLVWNRDGKGKFYIQTARVCILYSSCLLMHVIKRTHNNNWSVSTLLHGPQSYILSPGGGTRHHLSTDYLSLFGGIDGAGCLLEILDKRRHYTKLSLLDCEYLNFLSSSFLVITYQDGECVLSNIELAREGKLKVLQTSHFVAPVLSDCTVLDLQRIMTM